MFSEKLLNLSAECEKDCREQFEYIDDIAFKNTQKVMKVFRKISFPTDTLRLPADTATMTMAEICAISCLQTLSAQRQALPVTA